MTSLFHTNHVENLKGVERKTFELRCVCFVLLNFGSYTLKGARVRLKYAVCIYTLYLESVPHVVVATGTFRLEGHPLRAL